MSINRVNCLSYLNAMVKSSTANLGIGQPYQCLPDNIIMAGIKALMEGKTGYTPSNGILELRSRISSMLEYENLQYSADEIVVSSGSRPLITACINSLTKQDDSVIILGPYIYPQFRNICDDANRYPYIINVCDDNLEPNSVDFCRNIKFHFDNESKTRPTLMIINSPNNPTGSVYNLDLLKSIAQFCIAKNVIVISDEVYCDFVYDSAQHISIANLPGMRERTIVLRSFSKSYSMTGIRIGYAFGPRSIIKTIAKYVDHNISCPNSIGQYMAMAALENSDFTQNLSDTFFQNRVRLKAFFSSLKIKHVRSDGAFYMFVDIKPIIRQKIGGINNSLDFAMMMMKECDVLVIPGIAFGGDINNDHYIRVSYSVSGENIDRFISSFMKYCKN